MKELQDLEFIGSRNVIEEMIAELEAVLASGWSRDSEAEAQSPKNVGAGRVYCFARDAIDTTKGVRLWLQESNPGRLHVIKIAPREYGSISTDEYNLVLTEFYERFALPIADKLGLQTMLSDPDVGITKWISSDAAKELRSFSAIANRSQLHPADRERWFRFIVAVHLERSELDATNLARWLEEEEGWSKEKAYELECEFELAMELMAFYDAHR